jgi:hypothetical protein
MSLQPQGEDVRRAVKWIADERKFNPDRDINKLIQEAAGRFNLSPKDSEFLERFVKEKPFLDL